ncbi:hypothetical protein QTP88_007804 [Uroleucon formosanum]
MLHSKLSLKIKHIINTAVLKRAIIKISVLCENQNFTGISIDNSKEYNRQSMNRHRKIKQFFKDYVNQISPMMIELLEDELYKSTEKRKRIWTRKWTLRRGTHGVSVGLLRELASEDVNDHL